MKTYATDYYKNFKCLAGNCKHSCCKGWEVDIDEDTLEYYQTVEGEMGKRLKKAISYDGRSHFAMTENGDCPFLNSCGLCDIMIELGFDKVSEICDEHPRFYNFLSERCEVGLGMSCEAVAKIIVEKQDKMQLECTEDGDELLWEDECDYLDLRDDIFDILQNRDKPVQKRICEMLDFCGVTLPEKTLVQWADFFLSLERLEDRWTYILNKLKTADTKEINEEWYEIAVEQIAVYFVFRHFTYNCTEDEKGVEKAILFAAVSTGLIHIVCGMEYAGKGEFAPEDMREICRLYSGEVEYSSENTEKVMDLLKD